MKSRSSFGQQWHGYLGASRLSTLARALALWASVALLAASCAPYIVPAKDQTHHPTIFGGKYHTDDGEILPIRAWGPRPPTANAIILALHGFGDYRNAFDRLGMQLADLGVRTYAFDQRGFGEGPGRGYWHGGDRMIEDAADAVSILAGHYPETPVYLLGHSMGGAIAMATLAERSKLPLAGIIAVAPAVWGRAFMPGYQRRALDASAHTLPWLWVSGQGLDRVPSDNIPMLRALARDPHILRYYRIDTVWGLTNLMDRALRSAPRIKEPALFLYGLRDQLVPRAPTRAVLAKIPPENLTVAVYEDGHHMLLRDKAGDQVIYDIAAWLWNKRLALPSGAETDWKAHFGEGR